MNEVPAGLNTYLPKSSTRATANIILILVFDSFLKVCHPSSPSFVALQIHVMSEMCCRGGRLLTGNKSIKQSSGGRIKETWHSHSVGLLNAIRLIAINLRLNVSPKTVRSPILMKFRATDMEYEYVLIQLGALRSLGIRRPCGPP